MTVLSPSYYLLSGGGGGGRSINADGIVAGGSKLGVRRANTDFPTPPTYLYPNDPVPIPASGTNFSSEIWVMPGAYNYTGVSVSVTNVYAGMYADPGITGLKWWYRVVTGPQSGAALAATPPSPTNDNNITAPTLAAGAASALPTIASGGALMYTGPTTVAAVGQWRSFTGGTLYDGTGTDFGTWLSVVAGIDSTCTAVSDTALVNNALNLQFTWSEA